MSNSVSPRASTPQGIVFALAAIAATLWYAYGAWQDVGRRHDLSWAEPARIESPHCTTYNMVVTWCSANVESSTGMQNLHTLHLMHPGVYDWFSKEPKFLSESKLMVMGLRDRNDPSRVTTTTALDYAGARLGSALVMFVISIMLLLASFAGNPVPQQQVSHVAAAPVPERQQVVQRVAGARSVFGRK